GQRGRAADGGRRGDHQAGSRAPAGRRRHPRAGLAARGDPQAARGDLMRIRDEVRLGVGALLAIQVLTMIAAVALLARMTPAIDQILENNEKSIRAVERMLLVLAEPPPGPGQPDLRRAHFERALAEAQGNIT